MSEPFIAEIRIFAGTFAPRGWAFCNGQLLPIAQNTALFSLIGTTFGGDGRTTTALPDLRARVPMHPGSGPGLASRRLGERGGTPEVTLTEAQMPGHTHSANATVDIATGVSPEDRLPARAPDQNTAYGFGGPVDMAPDMLKPAGGGQPHQNRQPYLAMNFIIALVGLYPSRP